MRTFRRNRLKSSQDGPCVEALIGETFFGKKCHCSPKFSAQYETFVLRYLRHCEGAGANPHRPARKLWAIPAVRDRPLNRLELFFTQRGDELPRCSLQIVVIRVYPRLRDRFQCRKGRSGLRQVHEFAQGQHRLEEKTLPVAIFE